MIDNQRIKIGTVALNEHLREQISFMVRSATDYDKGILHEAKRLAHQLRILLQDKKGSKSLLGQLGYKKLRFINTASAYNEKNLISHLGLVAIRFKHGYRPWIVPKGDPDEAPQKYRIPFVDWWNMPVIVTPRKQRQIRFCRREIVLHVAETDGGSHVDDGLEKEYMALTRWNAVGITYKQNGVAEPIENPILPCVRQVTHEVLLLLRERVPDLFPGPYVISISDEPPEGTECTDVPTVSDLSFGPI